MRSKDVKATTVAKVLVIGEDSNLQWSDKVPEYVMFADYYFNRFPEDHGERSRNVEARQLFDHILYVTGDTIKASQIYFTNLCNDSVEPAPRGKRTLIPEAKAIKGFEHIRWILEENPSIEWILPMSLQANYWLQQLGLYGGDETFLHKAQPRRVGLEGAQPYYQPVDGKAFSLILGEVYPSKMYDKKVMPILPAKDFPLLAQNIERYEALYDKLRANFRK